MADEAQTETPTNHITFNVKSSNDAKYVLTVPESMTVADLKAKLASSEYADVPAERQRLIYSGRVLKDGDQLSSYKIKDGTTMHMVKSAPSSQRQQPTSSTVPGAGQSTGVPQNLAAGTGNDPLAGLTGARYAGFAQMPNANTFGPDGGLAPPDPEDLARQLENPMFQQQLNEAMNKPQVQQMMLNHPMVRNNPMARQMFENPEMRRMLFDPNVIRQSIQMQRMMGGNGGLGGGMGGESTMPAPGATDNTPGSQPSGQAQPGANNAAANPFAALFGGGGAGGAGGAGGPSLADMLAGITPPGAQAGSTTGPTGTDTQRAADGTGSANAAQANPFASMFGGAPGAGGAANPFQQATQAMQQNPELMRQMMASMFGGGAAGGQQGNGGFDPFSMLGGAGGLGGAAATPQDTRPPEEQYADQLRQLNDMGFFDFQQNVRALRMSGGRVEGAVELLLGGGFS